MNILKENTLSLLPEDLVLKARQMSKAYEYLYCVENVLRIYLDKHPKRQEFSFPKGVRENIDGRKKEESKSKWIALRGNSDLFYTDFKDLTGIIASNFELLKEEFPSEYWIKGKLDDLTRCRNLIAHNSYIDEHELDLIRVNFNSIIRQLNISNIERSDKITNNENETFVKGLNKTVVLSQQQVNNGYNYLFGFPSDIDVVPDHLAIFNMQGHICFKIFYGEKGLYIQPPFDVGITRSEGLEDYDKEVKFQIGMYDIDNDGLEELFICLGNDTEDYDRRGIEINIFKYYPPAFKRHSERSENWEHMGNFKFQNMLGNPEVQVEGNSFKAERGLRGFYYEWTFVKGAFQDTGYY